MTNITYQFAEALDGRSISIAEMDPKNRLRYGRLQCFGCKRPLVAALGPKMAHHFRHRHEGEASCSFETYLHGMTKQRVFEILSTAHAEKREILMRRFKDRGAIMRNNSGTILSENLRDLTHSILDGCSNVMLERMVEGVIPDVSILRSGTTPVFIEIAVTHTCEQPKIDLGLPIIEFNVSTEDDARRVFEQLQRGEIPAISPEVEFYNFPHMINEVVEKSEYMNRLGEELLSSFIPDGDPGIDSASEEMDTSETWRSRSIKVTDWSGALMRSGKVVATNDPDKASNFIHSGISYEVAEFRQSTKPLQIVDTFAHDFKFEKSQWVKSCLLCKRHGFSNAGRKGGEPMFCFHTKRACKHTEASACSSYYPYKTFEDLRQHRIRLANNPKSSKRSREMVPPKGGWFE